MGLAVIVTVIYDIVNEQLGDILGWSSLFCSELVLKLLLLILFPAASLVSGKPCRIAAKDTVNAYCKCLKHTWAKIEQTYKQNILYTLLLFLVNGGTTASNINVLVVSMYCLFPVHVPNELKASETWEAYT